MAERGLGWVNRLRDLLARPLFGRDLFISYSRRDATAYVRLLAQEIRKRRPEVSICIDQWAAAPHDTTHPNLLREARRCSLFVLVASANAVLSTNVRDEIDEFLTTGRYLLVINVDKRLGTGDVWSEAVKRILATTTVVEEAEAALDPKAPNPSADVVNVIVEAIAFETQTQRIRRYAGWTAAAALALIVAATGFSWWRISSANDTRDAARVDGRIAVHRTTRARAAADRANVLATAAEQREKEANERAGLAEGRATTAEKTAAAAEGRASVAAAAAEREQEVATALRLANESATLLRQQPHLVERAAELAVESMARLERRGVRALSADLALRDAVSLLPRIDRDDRVIGTMGQEALSPDGRLYVVTDEEKIALYDTATGASEPLVAKGHAPSRGWGTVVFSADSSMVAASVWTEETAWVHVWNTKTLAEAARLRLDSVYVDKLALSRGGDLLVIGAGQDVVVHDLRSQRELARRAAGEDLRSVALSADGELVLAAGESKVHVWRWRTPDAPQEIAAAGPRPQFAAFSPDDKHVLLITGHGLSVCEWPSAKSCWGADLRPPYHSVRFSPDGRRIAVSAAQTTRVYESADGRSVMSLPARADDVAFNADGSMLATGAFHIARIWRTVDGRELGRVAHPMAIPRVAFLRDGRVVSVAKGKQLKVWRANGELPILRTVHTAGDSEAIAFDPLTNELAISTSSIVGSNDELHRVAGDGVSRRCRPLISTHKAIAFTSDGRLIGGARTGHVRVWNAGCDDQQGKVIAQVPGAITALATSADGKMLAFAGTLEPKNRQHRRAIVRILLDWERGEEGVDLPHPAEVSSIGFRPDGEVVTGARDGSVRVWRWRQRTDAPVRELRHGPIVVSLAVDPTGRFIASAGHESKVFVWDLEKQSDEPVAVIPHDTAAWAVRFDPSGRFLATASSDGMAHVWEGWESGAPRDVVRVELGSGATHVAFSRDGRLLAAVTSGGSPSVAMTPWRQKDLIAAGRAALAAARLMRK